MDKKRTAIMAVVFFLAQAAPLFAAGAGNVPVMKSFSILEFEPVSSMQTTCMKQVQPGKNEIALSLPSVAPRNSHKFYSHSPVETSL